MRMKWSIHGLLTLAGTLAACGPSSTGATDPTDAGGDGSAQGGFDASAGDPDAGPPGRDASALQDSGVVAEGDGHVPSPDAAATLVQVPLGAYVGTWLGDTGSQYYTSWSDHWTAFVGAMGGRVPTVVGLPGMPYPPTNPDQWPNQSQYNVSNWPSVLPKSTSPLLTIWYVDANEQPIYAQAVDGTAYAGHSVDYWVQQTLQPYADFGVKKLYLRPAWEWNIGFQGQGITGDAGVGAATFVSAMQSFYTSAHAWAGQRCDGSRDLEFRRSTDRTPTASPSRRSFPIRSRATTTSTSSARTSTPSAILSRRPPWPARRCSR